MSKFWKIHIAILILALSIFFLSQYWLSYSIDKPAHGVDLPYHQQDFSSGRLIPIMNVQFKENLQQEFNQLLPLLISDVARINFAAVNNKDRNAAFMNRNLIAVQQVWQIGEGERTFSIRKNSPGPGDTNILQGEIINSISLRQRPNDTILKKIISTKDNGKWLIIKRMINAEKNDDSYTLTYQTKLKSNQDKYEKFFQDYILSAKVDEKIE